MSKQKGWDKITREKLAAKDESKSDSSKKKSRTIKSEGRESMEAVVVAFILAFLFRTFEAEAFVIPTGSMAPTLLGRNKEAECPKCGQHIVVGASDEVEQMSGRLDPRMGIVDTAFCPNCRYQVSLEDAPVFTGDRILVTKFPFEMSEPSRFDVIVFKYPNEPETNYIKRLIGLPGEELQIAQGDLYARESENGKWQILRKDDPNKQRRLQILVYDNNHPEADLHLAGWPKRWASMRDTGSGETERGELIAGWEEDSEGWQPVDDENSFRLEGTDNLQWLKYRHIVPDPSDWEEFERSSGDISELDPWNRLQLVSDFCGYNSYTGTGPLSSKSFAGSYFWVGDLTFTCDVDIEDASDGELLLELNEGVRQYRCRIDLSTGMATLFHPDVKSRSEDDVIELGTAQTPIDGSGNYEICFANVDNRLCLWVDGDVIDFGVDADGQPNAEYSAYGGNFRQRPTDRDLIPVGIAAKNATVTVSNLLLERDIYYQADSMNNNPHRPFDEDMLEATDNAAIPNNEFFGSTGQLASKLNDPAEWYEEYSKNSKMVARFAQLGDGEFFVLGDNSPRSRDSRLWTPLRPGSRWRGEFANWSMRPHSVPRQALVGKAFFIYWPHGKPFLNDGNGFPITYHKDGQGRKTDYPSFRFPFGPDIGRMRRIR